MCCLIKCFEPDNNSNSKYSFSFSEKEGNKMIHTSKYCAFYNGWGKAIIPT